MRESKIEDLIIGADKLINYIMNQEDLIFFVGAAISIWEPTNLPSGISLSRILFNGLTYKDDFLGELNRKFDEILNSNNKFVRVPLERIFSYLFSTLENNEREEFFKCFDYFADAKPNSIHELLLRITLSKKDRTIITTNFDNAFENVPNINKRIITIKNISEIYENVPDDTVKIIKLHGSIEKRDSITITLEQEGIGLDPRFQDYLRGVLANKTVCFIGYSASDFDIYPVLRKIDFKKVLWLEKPLDDKENVNKTINQRINKRVFKIIRKQIEKQIPNGFVCFEDMQNVFNEIIHSKYPYLKEIHGGEDYTKNTEITEFLSNKIDLPKRYLLVAKIFHLLLELKLTKKILISSIHRSRNEDKFKNYKDDFEYLLAATNTQEGNLIRAHSYYKKFYLIEKSKQKDNIKIYKRKLDLIGSLIMMRELEKAKEEISPLEEQINAELMNLSNSTLSSENTTLKRKDLESILFAIKNVKAKLNDLEIFSKISVARREAVENLKSLIEEQTLLLDELEKYERNRGNIDMVADHGIYKTRLKYLKGEYDEALDILDDLIETFEATGNVMPYINSLRDKSKVYFLKNEFDKSIEVHENILNISSIYGSDYQTRLKSYFALFYIFFLKHSYLKAIRHLFKFLSLASYCIILRKLPLKLIFFEAKRIYNLRKLSKIMILNDI